MYTINNRYLEFDGIAVDLRHVNFSADGLNDHEYIIFINVQRGKFSNFKVYSDLSLESLAELVFTEAVCVTDGVPSTSRLGTLAECVVYNEPDHNKSLIIQLHDKARVIVAKTIYLGENYHQRVSGYVDFENRHDKLYVRPSSGLRDQLDREYEIKLLEFT